MGFLEGICCGLIGLSVGVLGWERNAEINGDFSMSIPMFRPNIGMLDF